MGIVDDTIEGVVSYIAEFVGEVVVSGTVLVGSFPEYLIDSFVQWMAPITDPFLIAVPKDSQYAEDHNLNFTFGGTTGRFWEFGTETVGSFSFDFDVYPVTATETSGNYTATHAYAGAGELLQGMSYDLAYILVVG